MALLFVLLLIIFLAGFFGLETFAANFMEASDVKILGFSLLSPAFQVFFALGIIVCQFAIILFFMLDRIGQTIKESIKPLVRLVPFLAFVTTAYRTYAPVFVSLLPDGVAESLGIASNEFSITEAIDSGTFSSSVILTLLTMLLFIITTFALGPSREDPEVKALRAENAKLRKELRRGL